MLLIFYVRVTLQTRLQYYNLALQYRLDEFNEATQAILDGLSLLVPKRSLYLFNETQLELLVCGNPVVYPKKFFTRSMLNF